MVALAVRPAEFCRGLLSALQASEGRRKRRKRDTTPDALGLAIKRALLERAVADDPEPAQFEAWLVARCQDAATTVSVGAARAMALEIFDEWRLAGASPAFGAWLASGAPSADAG
ncbi:MAG TPA: hypothetical protein VFL90_13010 [Methylomirabilota bacterium]|nr:hypothetical protein [Methylomirabilota bacterium]